MKICLCLIAFMAGMCVTVTVNSDIGDASEDNTAVLTQDTALEESKTNAPRSLGIKKTPYGVTKDGQEVVQFICTNDNGLTLELINYGATVTSFKTPDKDGEFTNITLHCNDITGYEACSSYFGATVGRYCNRIANGKFNIDGEQYTLATNNAPNHLHGGKVGFDKRIWNASEIKGADWVGVRFTLTSADGDEGYPGELEVTADYILNNGNELIVELKATTDKATHVNLTNHNYWNLSGAGSGTVYEHLLKLEADQYLPVDSTAIPTGALIDVKETPFDFTSFHPIGSRLNDVVGDPVGYDHCFALRDQTGNMALAATVKDPASGRVMEIHTSQPGIQFYSGNFLDGQPGSGGFDQHTAFCLETQHFPDAPNQDGFASTLLEPGQQYHQKTIHKFSVRK